MKAVLDANVLYPAILRSLLIDLALLGAYEAHWTELIQQEWQRNLLKNRPTLKPENLKKVELLMNRALPDALVTGHESLIADINLPDPDDAHVVAAARHVGADNIVTANLRDFPKRLLEPYGITPLSADQFLVRLHTENAACISEALMIQSERYRNPPVTVDELLNQLSKQGAATFVKQFQEQG